MKGLRARLYKSGGQDFSNGGLSSRVDEVTLVGEEFPEVSEATEKAPAVRLVRRTIAGRQADYFEPVDQPEGMAGPMASGVYVATPDSRFSEQFKAYGAVPLHDRFETWEQYEALGR